MTVDYSLQAQVVCKLILGHGHTVNNTRHVGYMLAVVAGVLDCAAAVVPVGLYQWLGNDTQQTFDE